MSIISSVTIIRNDEDAEKFRQGLQKEMGQTDAEYWMKTDPNAMNNYEEINTVQIDRSFLVL